MTDDDSRAQGGDAPDGEPSRTYPDHLLRHGRERGLSKADRRYLASGGETVKNEGTDVNTRIRIRERVRESIVDFWLLTEYLSDHDRDLIFRESDDDWDNWELQIGLKNTIQFFYDALEHTDLTDFETVIESAVHDHERERHDGPIEVDVDFDVEVEQQFAIKDAYEKFQRGQPLTPMEVGVLLVSGQVHDPHLVQLLASHAHQFGEIHASIAPLLGQQLANIQGDSEPYEEFRFMFGGHSSDLGDVEPIEDVTWLTDYQYLEQEIRHIGDVADGDEYQTGAFCRWDPELAQAIDSLEEQREHQEYFESETADTYSEKLQQLEEKVERVEEKTKALEDHEAALRELSTDLDQPITVGDEVVYEDGDRHRLDAPDADEKGGDSPADTNDGADDIEG